MGSFDKDEARRIVLEGTDAEKIALIDELERQLRDRKFGLVWEHGGDGKNAAFPAEEIVTRYARHIPIPQYQEELSLSPQSGSLSKRERERERESSSELDGADTVPVDGRDDNLLLEGDNYVWLKMLEQSHKGKIDVIYIDPPYNTGHEDFVYNDKYTETTEEFFHSKWIDFMFRRLTLANTLLADEGLIFISIGEQEIAPLKMLCDSIFSSFITVFHWIQTATPPFLGRVRNDIEYILCYQKTETKMKLFGRNSSESDAPLKNNTNRMTTIKIPAEACSFPNFESGTIVRGNKASGTELLCDIIVSNHRNINEFSVRFKSKWHQENLDAELISGTELIVKNITNFGIRYKKKEVGYVIPNKFLSADKFDVKTNEYGRKQLLDILGYAPFSYPKNTPLIKTLIRMYRNEGYKDITVLDFFAGSGTTAQAVAELNAEDGGNRRWILVTNNEGETDDDPSTGIMRAVTKPRIDTVLTGIRPDGTRYSNGTGDGYSFFTYDIDSVPRSESPNRNRRMLTVPQYLDGFIRIRWGVARSDIRSSGTCFPVDYESKTTHVVALLTDGSGKVELDDIRSEAQALVNEENRQRVIVAPAAAVLVARPIWDTIVGDADIELLSYDDLFDNDFLS